jgi:hypothetical protein
MCSSTSAVSPSALHSQYFISACSRLLSMITVASNKKWQPNVQLSAQHHVDTGAANGTSQCCSGARTKYGAATAQHSQTDESQYQPNVAYNKRCLYRVSQRATATVCVAILYGLSFRSETLSERQEQHTACIISPCAYAGAKTSVVATRTASLYRFAIAAPDHVPLLSRYVNGVGCFTRLEWMHVFITFLAQDLPGTRLG